MKEINGIWTLYSGDLDDNGYIDLADVLLIHNDALQFITGLTDLNCDDYTDLSDVLIAYNNSVNFVKVEKP